jgi:hypothetical protein
VRVPFDQQKNAVIPVEDAPHCDLQVIQGTQERSLAHAGGIQKYFQKNKSLFRYSRSIFNIIPFLPLRVVEIKWKLVFKTICTTLYRETA